MNTTVKQASMATDPVPKRFRRDRQSEYQQHLPDHSPSIQTGPGCGCAQAGEVLPYMDDFPMPTSRNEEACELQDHAERVLNRPGLPRNVKQGQWYPVQTIEHFGLEVERKKDLEDPELHTFESVMAWGGVPNLNPEGGGLLDKVVHRLREEESGGTVDLLTPSRLAGRVCAARGIRLGDAVMLHAAASQ
ncbi:hypothetical protein CYMTET_46703 [Cymbomonas tetramitiformis]|uniref:Uncharacterized protein n=1 Tax=Cymbomonas tetramitiformis TaxID=36881 RepID=A0AAE0BVP7_9CHLO|nr:hypothetical protein CYMTET_46703 [Cymbomonas tetramitiformis]